MAILGNIIKGLIGVRGVFASDQDHFANQKGVLSELLEKAKKTEFGKHYKFPEIIRSENPTEEFSKKIPFFDYHKMDREWWSKLHTGEKDVSWPGRPPYFALSSGTTGSQSKRIPITEEMTESIRKTGVQQVFSLHNFDLPADFFEKEILMLGSSTSLEERNGHKEGEISGISASNIPFWFRNYYKPGMEIAQIDDWDKRVQKIVEHAAEWDIGALSGIPSWVELMIQRVICHHKLDHIHQIWPNLRVFTSGGVAFQPYEKSFNALLGKPVEVIDTYLASEGFLAFQCRPETDAMQLVTDNGIYFEFVPFKPEFVNEDGSLVANAPAMNISDVRENEDYVLIISTVTGAWRYIIGDTIKFTDVNRAEIKITGRTKFFLNVVGSQLSVNKMNDALRSLEEKYDMKIPEFTLCAKRIDGEFYHCWYLGAEGEGTSELELAKALDHFLKEANKNYGVARSKALKGVKVTIVSPEVFYEWNARNKKKGDQVKMERVMDEKKFAKWQKFVQSELVRY